MGPAVEEQRDGVVDVGCCLIAGRRYGAIDSVVA